MNITTEPDQEVWHDMQEPGAYEWWYFDAEDPESGLSFVLIWFAGFPFSPYYTSHYEKWKNRITATPPHPSSYAGFSFQLYENGCETLNFIKEGHSALFESSRSAIGVRFENNRFSYDPVCDEYHLDIDFLFPARHKALKATLVFKSRRRVVYEKKDGNNAGQVPLHQWFLSVSKADVTGTIEIIEQGSNALRTIAVRATGYHDHNLGNRPMHEYIARWYWGRAFFGEVDLVYYVIFFKNNEYQPLTLLVLQDNLSEKTTVLDSVEFSERNFQRGFFFPLHSKDLLLQHEDISLRIHHERILDSGPFYLRFASALSLQIDGRNLPGIKGISEFLNPAPLQSRLMQFFIRSRIWREGEPSVMYNNYNNFKHALDWIYR